MSSHSAEASARIEAAAAEAVKVSLGMQSQQEKFMILAGEQMSRPPIEQEESFPEEVTPTKLEKPVKNKNS